MSAEQPKRSVDYTITVIMVTVRNGPVTLGAPSATVHNERMSDGVPAQREDEADIKPSNYIPLLETDATWSLLREIARDPASGLIEVQPGVFVVQKEE